MILNNNNKLNTKDDLPKLCVKKEAYVILPCHPFYGLKVEIIQQGETSTQKWCLIACNEQKDFHYRIPARWLDNKPPHKIEALPYKNKIIPFPFGQLQKLALLIQYRLQKVFPSDEIIVASGKQQIEVRSDATKNNKENSKNLDQNSSNLQDKTYFKTSVDVNNRVKGE